MASRTRTTSPRRWIISAILLFLTICAIGVYQSRPLDVHVVALTKNITPGKTATIIIQGEPQTTYSISVQYKSGLSKAAGLHPKKSDDSGLVSWSWIVGTRTTKGQWPILIRKGSRTFSTSFNVQ